jgi:hypothetical protein
MPLDASKPPLPLPSEQPPRRERTSDILTSLIDRDVPPETPVRFASIVYRLNQRAFGFLLVLFALPCCLPGPPGFMSALGLPILVIAWQMAVGRPKPWLPKAVHDRIITQETLNKFIEKSLPPVRAIEKVCRPRLEFLTSVTAERFLGMFIFLLALCITLPLPLSNFPPGVATLVMGLALIERDGLVLGLGATIGVAALGIIFWLTYLAILAGGSLLSHFGL